MKKFRKVIVSLVTVASMISFAAVNASAVDYGVDPDYNEPSNPTVQPETPDDSVVVGSAEEPVETVTEETISSAIDAVVADSNATSVTIYVGEEEATITEAAIGEIAKNDVVVTLKSESCTVTIDPALITEVKDIDLAMNVFTAEDDVEGVSVPKGAIVIAPAQKGDFGMTVEVTVPAETVKALSTDTVFFYYISDNGEIEDLSDKITVNEDGSISVAISHASQYVVTDEEIVVEDKAPAGDADASENGGSNPGTGVSLFGTAALAVSSVVAAATAKKRK